jgi:hypothetical protein
MDPVTIAALVLSIIGVVASTVSPLVLAGAYFVNRITESDCCLGGRVLLSPPTQQIPSQPINPPLDLKIGTQIQK